MKTEKLITLEEAHALLQPMVGALAWFVRTGADRILRIEFGEPHLSVSDIRPSGDAEGSIGTVSRRVAVPTGQWSLFVEDADWTIFADPAQVTRFGTDTVNDDRHYGILSGQRVSSLTVGRASSLLTIDFDLGYRLIVNPHIDFETNSQWMMFFDSGIILAAEADGSFALESD